MNYKNSKFVAILPKAVRGLTAFCILISGLTVIFHSPNAFSAQSTIDCADSSIINSQPGSNCLFSSGSSIKPLCQTIPNAEYTLDPDNILSSTSPAHRFNCMNLSDLQLCDHSTALYSTCSNDPNNSGCEAFLSQSKQNCAQNCNSSSFNAVNPTDIRGVDYAVHDRDCIRFCDEIADENSNFATNITMDSGHNCIARGCHQLNIGVIPSPGNNCTLTACNLLTISELNNVGNKLYDDEINSRSKGNYCNKETDIEGKELKCYKFAENQLPYTIVNEMCQPHNCKPQCSNYTAYEDVNGDGIQDENDNDDTLNISNQGDAYKAKYITYINAGLELEDSSLCKPVICLPVINRQFRCTTDGNNITGDNDLDIVRNSNCDISGDGSICENNVCFKKIDCNDSTNAAEPECITKSEEGEIIIDDDNSWFYRPEPMGKATNGNYLISDMTEKPDGLCYTKAQLELGEDTSSDDQHWGVQMEIPLPFTNKTIDLGYAHSYLRPDETRSPGLCDPSSSGKVTKEGFRGTGYVYLCYGSGNPNSGQLYAKVADHTAYHKGGVTTSYTEEDGYHTLRVCLRMRNSLRPDDGKSETCGKRECGISCLFGICKSQVCGYDVCRTLKLKDSNPDECKMDGTIFSGDHNRDCMATIDNYLRLRVQKYGNEICSYLDVKGHLAYEIDWFNNGSEKINDLYCTSGSDIGSDGSCNGYDTRSDPGLADRWRTINFDGNGTIPYITNNQSVGEKPGYRDKSGTLISALNCIKTALRLPPPRIYNLANASNSPKLFIPPIFLSHAFSIKDGIIAAPAEGETFGKTDFNKPEINVTFGSTNMRLSLETDFDGYEADNQEAEDPNGKGTISTTINDVTYDVDIFVRKEYDELSKNPTFCLYRKMQASDGTDLSPSRIQCVVRNLPEYDNSLLRQIFTNLPPKKIVIYPSPSNSFNDSSIILRYLSDFGDNGIDDNCSALGDDECSSELILDNPSQSTPNCSADNEQFPICAQREKCNKLNNECMQNEIDLQDAILSKNNTLPYLLIRRECNEVLLPYCNKKKGITATPGSATITNPNPSGSNEDPNAYGWFNEICLISGSTNNGFDHELDQVIAYSSNSLTGGIKGKCLVDSLNSPYLTDNDPSTDCDDGGKAPNCLCVNYIDGVSSLSANQEVRTETYREAGFCVDIPIPETCPAIIANTIESANFNDLDYVYSSISTGESFYDDSSGVHTSHLNRTNALAHADFPLAIMGTNSVTGVCKGFWKNKVASNGIAVPPTRNCLNNNGSASWENSINNAAECERYSCPIITTSGPISEITPYSDYSNNYGDLENGDLKGSSQGFALWPSHTKTNDYPETVQAISCIDGFKPSGSSALPNGASAIKEEITGYSTGTPSTRICDQLGQYEAPIHICERITCPAINPPTNPTTNADWAEWAESGGAKFDAINASRSSNFIAAESIQSGVCDNNLGFFQLGGNPPTRTCDHLGNWGPVTDECTTRCKAVTSTDYILPDNNHGNTYWPETNLSAGSELEVEAIGTANGCANSLYKPYPYPPLNDSYGDLFTLTSATADYTTTIPVDVKNDTRTVDAKPKRMCKSVSFQTTSSDFWFAASSKCITGCPGYNDDPRINVGITKHNTRAGEIQINWPNTSFDTWVYVSNQSPTPTSGTPNFNGVNAADYSGASRTTGDYMLARKCSPTGKWEDPIPQCVTNDGIITGSNALYSSATRHGIKTIDVGGTTEAIASSCSSGFYNTDQNTTNPKPVSTYTCEYNDNSKKIDEVYFKHKSGDSCQRYCRAQQGDTFNIANYYSPASTIYKDAGETLYLSCASGYGGKILGGNAGGDDTCGRNASDRSGDRPYVTCQADGTWSTTNNSCSACRSCTCTSETNCPTNYFTNTSLQQIVPYCYKDRKNTKTDICTVVGNYNRVDTGTCGNGGDHEVSIYPPTLASGVTGTTYFNEFGEDSSFIFTCLDGQYKTTLSGNGCNGSVPDSN